MLLFPYNLFSLPEAVGGILSSDIQGQGFLLGVIEIREYRSTVQILMAYPMNDTSLIRRFFYLALDIQECSLPYYDEIREAFDRVMFAALVAIGYSSNKTHPKVLEVIEDINRNFTNPYYDLGTAIDRTEYSPNHFRKIFRSHIGVTPLEFLENRRLEKAAELFVQFKMSIPIKEIALQCGFHDPYYFSRQFKKRYGMSPRSYIETL